MGSKIKKILLNEVSGWKPWEVIWLLINCSIIMGLSIYWKDSLMGIVCATTGVACVVFTGKGKLSAYAFGAVNALLYAIIAFQAKYYGEVMLNAFYCFPMQFYGFFVWSKNMNRETHEVKKRKMTASGRIKLFAIVFADTALYGLLLRFLGGALPFADALSTVISVAALIISVKMYVEQWLLWIVVDIATIIMWGIAFAQGSGSAGTLLMWIVYLGNGFVMYFKWMREIKQNKILQMAEVAAVSE